MIVLTDHAIDAAPCNGYGRCNAAPVWISAVHRGRRVVSFPPTNMGQYFKAVNLDKKEVVCPWCIGGGAKLWEWAANSCGAVFVLLLRKSSQTGGGDFRDPIPQSERVLSVDDSNDPEQSRRSLQDAIGLAVAAEGMPTNLPDNCIAGRWAGDRVVMLGDYDESELWKELPTYRNISKELVETWNKFIELEDHQLRYWSGCSCNTKGGE